MLIQQRQYEDHDAGESKQSLYEGGGQVADEDAACRVRGAVPVGSCGARFLLALTRALEVFTRKTPAMVPRMRPNRKPMPRRRSPIRAPAMPPMAPPTVPQLLAPKRRAPYEVATKSATKAIAANTKRITRIAAPTVRKSVSKA